MIPTGRALANAQNAPPPSTATSAEVTITAPRFHVETLIDRTVYTLNADLQADFGSISDVLSSIPSIVVDVDGNVALRGDSSVLVLVDGRPMQVLAGSSVGDALQQYAAADVERIEVITSPPAEFKAEGAAGVLNIVTRHHRRPGVSGTLQSGVGNHERSFNAGTLADNFGRWHLSGGASFRDDDRLRNAEASGTAVDPATGLSADTQHAIHENIRRRFSDIKGEAGFDIDDSRQLVLALDWNRRTGARWYDEYTGVAEPPGSPAVDSLRHSAGRESAASSDQRLSYSQSLGAPAEKLDVSLHHDSSDSREHYDYTNFALDAAGDEVGGPSLDNLDLHDDHAESELTFDWTRPLGGVRQLKAGLDLEADDDAYGSAGANINPVTGSATLNALITDVFRFRRVVDAAYASYEDRIGAWTWLGGLRYEWVRDDAEQVTDGVSAQTRRDRIYPTLHVERSLSATATLSIAVARRVSLPYADVLNPFTSRRDIYNISAGNPNLLPEDTRAYEVGVHVSAAPVEYGATVYYRQNRDSVTSVSQVVAEDVLLSTFGNLPKNDAAGLELTANGPIGRHWTYILSANAFYDQIDATALGVPGLSSTTGVNGKLTLDYRPTKTQAIQFLLTRSDRRLTPQGYVGAVNQLNVGYRRVIAPNLRLVATISDVFQTQVQRRSWLTPTFTQDYRRTVVGRMGYVGLVFRFGTARKDPSQGFDYDN